MSDAYLISACRTPIGKFLGALSDLPATELGATVVREAVRRAGVEPGDVDEVILGNVLSAGLGQAPARQAALKAGLSPEVAALTINKMCGSGLKAVMLAAQAVGLGDADVVVAGGMENMTRAPFLLSRARHGWKYGDQEVIDSMLRDGLWCAFEDCHMGREAEHVARLCSISRDDQDRFAAESQRRAAAAEAGGAFDEEIVPLSLRTRAGEELMRRDEGPRAETTVDKLAALKPAFEPDGTVTAGNSSMLSDGAAAVVVTTAERAKGSKSGIKARIVAYATAGTEPRDLFLAPVDAVRKALTKAGLSAGDIDLFEINEAFAAQMLACIRRLELDPAKVNVHGGAIALGHPIGASGARVLTTLLYALKHRDLKRGVASLCLGGGNAVALIVERD